MMKLLSPEEPRAPFAGTFSAANLCNVVVSPPLLLPPPPDSPHRINCSCWLLYLQVFDATAHKEFKFFVLFLIHPHPSHILFWDVPFGHFLGRIDHFCMCESHFRRLGLYIFTTRSPWEWLLKSCFPIMTHYLSLFLGERLSVVDKWLEFQNHTNISTETFCFPDESSPGYWPSTCCCVASVISLYLNVWTLSWCI